MRQTAGQSARTHACMHAYVHTNINTDKKDRQLLGAVSAGCYAFSYDSVTGQITTRVQPNNSTQNTVAKPNTLVCAKGLAVTWSILACS